MNFAKTIRSKILRTKEQIKEQTSSATVPVTEAMRQTEEEKVVHGLSEIISVDVFHTIKKCDEKPVEMVNSERPLVNNMNVNGVLSGVDLSYCWRCRLRGTETDLKEHDSECFCSSSEAVSCPSILAQEFATKHSLSPGGINDLYTLLYHFQHAAQLLFLVFFY